jgi:hypothetical protein
MAGTVHDPLLWLGAKQRRYVRRASRWRRASWILWLLCLAPLVVIFLSRASTKSAVPIEPTVALFLVSTLFVFARIVLQPGERARRYKKAALVLEAALVRYDADPGEGLEVLESADTEVQRLLCEPFKTQY